MSWILMPSAWETVESFWLPRFLHGLGTYMWSGCPRRAKANYSFLPVGSALSSQWWIYSPIYLTSNFISPCWIHYRRSIAWEILHRRKSWETCFEGPRMHFNHVIKPSNKSVINRQCLLNIMARGAGVLGANCKPGCDITIPFLYKTDDLDIKKVGFIMVQVKNSKSLKPIRSEIMTKMD